jgi:hypothetical protein
MQRSLSLPGPAHASPRTWYPFLSTTFSHPLSDSDLCYIYTDLTVPSCLPYHHPTIFEKSNPLP